MYEIGKYIVSTNFPVTPKNQFHQAHIITTKFVNEQSSLFEYKLDKSIMYSWNTWITIRILDNTCFYIRNKLWILLANRLDWWQEHSVQFVVTVRPSIHINNLKFVSILRHREKLRNCYLDTCSTAIPEFDLSWSAIPNMIYLSFNFIWISSPWNGMAPLGKVNLKPEQN